MASFEFEVGQEVVFDYVDAKGNLTHGRRVRVDEVKPTLIVGEDLDKKATRSFRYDRMIAR